MVRVPIYAALGALALLAVAPASGPTFAQEADAVEPPAADGPILEQILPPLQDPDSGDPAVDPAVDAVAEPAQPVDAEPTPKPPPAPATNTATDADAAPVEPDAETTAETTVETIAEADAVAADPAADPADAIDFGDDTSMWANDEECDDPRFEGPGMAALPLPEDRMRDASDCRAAFEAGTVILRVDDAAADSLPQIVVDPMEDLPPMVDAPAPGDAPAVVDDPDDFDYGDDSSAWANNGECDDPRFEAVDGARGMAMILLPADEGRDATDCQSLVEDGAIRVKVDDLAPPADDKQPPADDLRADGFADDLGYDNAFNESGVDFGDDASRWANNGECDDPRFENAPGRSGMASALLDDDIGRDASDCRALFNNGAIRLVDGDSDGLAPLTPMEAIDFGNDASRWANDNECDDPRFEGPGVAAVLLDDDLGRDATDCRNLFAAGQVWLKGEGPIQIERADIADILFGDDSGQYPNDDECDDPRFVGQGVAAATSPRNLGADAADCQALYETGAISLAPGAEVGLSDAELDAVNFGDDTSRWANDSECDDPRFEGTGVANVTLPVNEGRDATDCRRMLQFGGATLKPDYGPGILDRMAEIDFGDDSGPAPSNGVCDDPRFVGRAMARTPAAEGGDASDCRMLYRLTAIQLYDESSGYGICQGIVFGDDSGSYPNDDECDDPRFEGEAMGALGVSNILRDASDCRSACNAGTVTLRRD